jgi:glycine/D-amino acid oxidase-like deaminating enzyme
MPQNKSIWQDGSNPHNFPALGGDIQVDTVIVGGGITGLTAAYLLKQSGQKVALMEKRTIGAGTTGRTTGKVSSLHEIVYSEIYDYLGEPAARIYGQANQAAVEAVRSITKIEKMTHVWEDEDNYTYTTEVSQIPRFKHEVEIAARLGLPASFESTTALPFEVKAAIKFHGQGKIHSQRYLSGLAKAINGNGSHVFEHSNVIGIRDGQPCRVKTAKATVWAKHIIVATNVPTLPLMARGTYCALEYPTESYIVAGQPSVEIKGMYISPDDNHYSILPVTIDGESRLLIGGGGHVSGMRLSHDKRFQRLADYAAEHFGMEQITHRWSDRDYRSYDGLPLAGKAYPWSKNLYVASAFRKWGLSNGTAAAMIIHDLIMGQTNPWAEVFNPVRIKPILSIPRASYRQLFG